MQVSDLKIHFKFGFSFQILKVFESVQLFTNLSFVQHKAESIGHLTWAKNQYSSLQDQHSNYCSTENIKNDRKRKTAFDKITPIWILSGYLESIYLYNSMWIIYMENSNIHINRSEHACAGVRVCVCMRLREHAPTHKAREMYGQVCVKNDLPQCTISHYHSIDDTFTC